MEMVVLDRDGVINHDSDHYIRSADEWLPIDGSIEAIACLSKAGFRIMVATNQSGLGRKLFDEYALAQMHQKLCSMVEDVGGVIDGVFYCPHTPQDCCDCRKPGVGLLQQIEREFDCSLHNCFFVGDSYKDVQSALAFGLAPVLVRTGKGLATENLLLSEGLSNVPVFDDLASAVSQLIIPSMTTTDA